jgi:hypothetical protein
MILDPQLVVAVTVPTVIVIVWLVRLEGRINLADQRHNDLKDDISEIKADVKRIRSFMGGGVDR